MVFAAYRASALKKDFVSLERIEESDPEEPPEPSKDLGKMSMEEYKAWRQPEQGEEA